MYSSRSNLVLGFHGCNKETFKNVLYEHEQIKKSKNDYDWLGNGIYFWEYNLTRALQWSQEHGNDPPYVIGAVIDLGLCLDFCDSNNLILLKNEHTILQQQAELANIKLPTNSKGRSSTDLLLRRLDCAVIEHLHQSRKQDGYESFDSVRGVFYEGEPLYENSGFTEKNHIQICVRNPNCIKGYFSPQAADRSYRIV